MIKDRRILEIIAIIVLLLLLWFFFQPTDATVDPEWAASESNSGGAKLHEEQVGTGIIYFADCCDGEVKVSFQHKWDFYFDDNPEDCCHNPVVWTLKDSSGRTVFTCDELCPNEKTETITDGVWDCLNPLVVVMENGCLYPINYEYELTLYCLDDGSTSTGTWDFWDWVTFWD